MKTLVIHPKDRTTEFLSKIYENIPNKTVVREGLGTMRLNALITQHDRVIMMGHGTPDGLMSVGVFPIKGGYVINEMTAKLLRGNKENVYIWCHADKFVEKHGLEGFYSGMFVSETYEAMYCGVKGLPSELQRYVDESNNQFSEIMSECINNTVNLIHDEVIERYGKLAEKNPVAKYNMDRIRSIHPLNC